MESAETHPSIDAPLDLIELVRAKCREHPAALAIEAANGHLTYAELGNQADIIGAMVRSACASGEVIAVSIADRATIIPAMLGVLQAGCIFVPLNDEGPAERLHRLVTWLQPKVFFTTEPSHAAVERLGTSLGEGTSILTLAHVIGNSPHSESSPACTRSPAAVSAPPN